MKIGILTFHRAHNYGAMLQAYGLFAYLKTLGHEVNVIDYAPSIFKKGYRRSIPAIPRNPINICKTIAKEPFLHNDRVKRYDAFDGFIHSALDLYPYNEGFDGNEFDLIFIGSDQVWNKHCIRALDKVYWGEALKCKIASYAASMAWYRPSDNELPLIQNYLNRFSHVSVREKDAADYLRTIISKPVEVVCDPTLLLQAKDWENICKPIPEKKKYLLCYNLVDDMECKQVAETIAKEKGLKEINLVGSASMRNPKGSLVTAGPCEFLSYFKHAEYVVTSSFHGTVFSLIFKKQFLSVTPSKFAGRASYLLKTVGLEERMQIPSDIKNIPFCNYDDVDKRLSQFIASSKEFIVKCLS